MIKVDRKTILANLDSWGTVADLGSEILEGEAKAFGRLDYGTPTAPISSGYFGVTKSKFRMVYPFNEHATVVEGKVTLTDESTGKSQTFETGDSWFMAKGTPILWNVQSDAFVKHYVAAA